MLPAMHRAHRSLVCLSAGLLLCAVGCKGKAPPPAKPAAAAAAPIVVPPPPSCDLPKEDSSSRPRGTVLALYHTANVVGEVDPCG
jgi:hypothetical protein